MHLNAIDIDSIESLCTLCNTLFVLRYVILITIWYHNDFLSLTKSWDVIWATEKTIAELVIFIREIFY
eukprot:snap_masked-scaffold_6-processed-gene-14.30-mRNA-1 protein AED:1.00 eAED:1.00 QI:0/0/0/0/1/1/2/0/67